MKTEKKRRFTLVEMVAALSIMMVIAGIIAGAVSIFATAYIDSRAAAATLRRNRTISAVADRVLRTAVPFVWTDDDTATERSLFHGTADELYTASLNRAGGAGSSPFIFTRIRLAGSAVVCDTASLPMPYWDDIDRFAYTTETVATDVRSLKFRYFNQDDDGEPVATDSWSEDYEYTIPLAIQLEIEFSDGTTERRLRRTAGNGGYTRFGSREEALE
ncbi:MAG: type II secretion system protein [Victivallaceae bacterium]|nr:type II secretion system protein [Victivallaceae bacterium]